jgi:hypothetical protein
MEVAAGGAGLEQMRIIGCQKQQEAAGSSRKQQEAAGSSRKRGGSGDEGRVVTGQ